MCLALWPNECIECISFLKHVKMFTSILASKAVFCFFTLLMHVFIVKSPRGTFNELKKSKFLIQLMFGEKMDVKNRQELCQFG